MIFGTLIYFIEDPFILIAYVLAFKYRMWPKWNMLSICACILGLIYVVLGIVQIAFLNAHPFVTAYGMRLYFWYVPLAFLIGENFKGKDLARLVRQTLLISIPIAALVYVQFRSPPDALVNRYLIMDIDPALVGEVVRTSGTFSLRY